MDDQPDALPLDDRLSLAADPDTDRGTAAMLAADPDPAVRSELAVNCRHADVLEVLSHDADPNVVWELCSYNRATPAEVLLRIVAAPPLDVPAEIAVKWAAVNPGATAEVLAAVANHPASPTPLPPASPSSPRPSPTASTSACSSTRSSRRTRTRRPSPSSSSTATAGTDRREPPPDAQRVCSPPAKQLPGSPPTDPPAGS